MNWGGIIHHSVWFEQKDLIVYFGILGTILNNKSTGEVTLRRQD
jgi:hypothetical protein